MKRLGNKGFTLIELIATLVILTLVMGLGAYSITGLITSSKKKDYELLIKEINNAVEIYYQECRYVNNNCSYEITLGFLVDNGYLKGNSEITDGEDNKYKNTLINPNDNVNISNCKISYEYKNGKVSVSAVDTSGSCPTSCDYNPGSSYCEE
ncbi:MAG: prepilin-type N-terminal cleavage/methylation domain-containing protein [Bacilli bacterium]|nr:prepilin-type N-terminal cleavage/methylation domain-containing protein [Bacilli bacterium]